MQMKRPESYAWKRLVSDILPAQVRSNQTPCGVTVNRDYTDVLADHPGLDAGFTTIVITVAIPVAFTARTVSDNGFVRYFGSDVWLGSRLRSAV